MVDLIKALLKSRDFRKLALVSLLAGVGFAGLSCHNRVNY